ALADALAALGLKFDSEASLEAIDAIMRQKCQAEFDSSIDMAIERGSFEGFDPEIENTSEFVGMLKTEFPDMYARMMKAGRRNISISTVAPTGTLSLLAQTSSGIEPVFMLSYKRRRKLSDKNSDRVAFVDDTGDAWEEFTVYHPKLKTWMNASGKTEESDSPYAGATAPEIDWKKRIEIQALVQKYTTHSISSTLNLPADVSVDKVGQIYVDAWKQGLKGITVYRDGSRSGVLVSTEEKKETPISAESTPPVRPDVLEAKLVRFMNEKEKWLAFIGILNDRPYEIFTGKAEEAFALPEYVKDGWIIKSYADDGTSRYDFRYTDRHGFNVTIEGLSRSFNQEFWNYAKLISGILRHGMPLPYVVDLVEHLNLDKEFINTWKNGVARALKTFIPDGTQAVDKQCPECRDEEGLIYQEGCLTCKSCGYSKCG
ncbi:MAG: ribonucleoside-diphosphate reductase, adenosylcobalamin-dependent, partial [Bacteroidota bacterium]|nr:ribonucleoside-diphosphate reductase, adenosylcobalamin-dependent [Bacteroidota bacterium]